MEIVHCLLEAINPVSRPQTIPIHVLRNHDIVLGRANFFDGEDTIISRRHARFSILSGLSAGQQPDKLQVSNLSHVNGLLVNFEPLQPFQSCTLQNGDEICFSGAHGLTSRIEEEELPFEAERYRYRVVIVRGSRNNAAPSRKRGRESLDEGQRKRIREEDVILLSSDNDETKPILSRTTSGRRASPVSISSTTDSSESENNAQAEAPQVLFRDGRSSKRTGEITEDEDDNLLNVEAESSGTTSSSPNKGKGKEVDTQEPLDLQEELECFICSNLMVAPHICSPCGHGGCGPCITKWFEKSETCPQCRGKLSPDSAFVKDYILERIVDKYARTILPLEEITGRELQAREFLESQRQRKENPKPISWFDRARELNMSILPEQHQITADTVLRQESTGIIPYPPGWNHMSGRAKAQYQRWRGECIDWHARMTRLGVADGHVQENRIGPYASGRESLPPTVQNPQNQQQNGQNLQPRRPFGGRDPIIPPEREAAQPNRTPTYAKVASRHHIPRPSNHARLVAHPRHPNAHLLQHVGSAEDMTRPLVRAETVAVVRRDELLDRTRLGHDGFTHAVQPLLKPNLTAIPRHPVNGTNTPNTRDTPSTRNPSNVRDTPNTRHIVPGLNHVFDHGQERASGSATRRSSSGAEFPRRTQSSTSHTGQDINWQTSDRVPGIASAQIPVQPSRRISTPTHAESQDRNQTPRTDDPAATPMLEESHREQMFPDPEWLRAVRTAFGPGGVQQVHQESLRVMMEHRRADPSQQRPLEYQPHGAPTSLEQREQRLYRQLNVQMALLQRNEHLQNHMELVHQMGDQGQGRSGLIAQQERHQRPQGSGQADEYDEEWTEAELAAFQADRRQSTGSSAGSN